ncbi:c3hc4 type (ring finger) zinc finger containing protein [Lentinula edodes]|uniref:RING-type E3 ubiquitin transferase n=1 Tax=Lentinula edodes TaxID=5353 RepID=A0A1Q3E313_LENED|nr:c3hc4 type (ring finger) zinc finger containing protein [Lentinula edodes]
MPSSPHIPPSVNLHPPSTPIPANVQTNNTEPGPPLRSPVCPPNHSTIAKILHFFGLGDDASEVRRTLVSLIWNLGWGFAQMVGIVVVLASFAPKASPTVPGANEWSACHLPLGIWSCLWLGRTIVVCVLDYWKFTRERSIQSRNTCIDPESSQRRTSSSEHSGQICSPNAQQPPLPDDNSSQTQNDHLPHTVMFKRLSSISLMYSIYWFLTAYILAYSSIKTCRLASPHLWWLIVAIYCTMYLKGMCLHLIGLVLALVFLIWRLFLLCIGRRPSQNSQMIKPDIGKLPKNLVDRIPLVVYIPTPPDASPTEGPIQMPTNIYSYSPKSPVRGTEIPAKKCFRFIKFHQFSSKFNKTTNDGPTGILKQANLTESGFLEDSWDTGGYPHVVLDDNRAACAICLLDFEEPKRLHIMGEEQSKGGQGKAGVISEKKYENDELKSADVNEGAQLLRLLRCGHVFHKTCLDPWLTDISGRCPVCQRQVEILKRETEKEEI